LGSEGRKEKWAGCCWTSSWDSRKKREDQRRDATPDSIRGIGFEQKRKREREKEGRTFLVLVRVMVRKIGLM